MFCYFWPKVLAAWLKVVLTIGPSIDGRCKRLCDVRIFFIVLVKWLEFFKVSKLGEKLFPF